VRHRVPSYFNCSLPIKRDCNSLTHCGRCIYSYCLLTTNLYHLPTQRLSVSHERCSKQDWYCNGQAGATVAYTQNFILWRLTKILSLNSALQNEASKLLISQPTLGTTLRHFRPAHLHKIYVNVILPSPFWSSLQILLTEHVVLYIHKQERGYLDARHKT